jgi:hypothetical protein
VELNPQDQSAVRIVAQMDELFAIDAQARQERLSQEDRQLLRLNRLSIKSHAGSGRDPAKLVNSSATRGAHLPAPEPRKRCIGGSGAPIACKMAAT